LFVFILFDHRGKNGGGEGGGLVGKQTLKSKHTQFSREAR
jgi:hypothetical protein